MTEQEALKLMVAPGTRRPGKYREGVIQVHVTRACDKACANCTQGSCFSGPPRFISLEAFEACVLSLRGYWGVVGVFGGNPALHPQFPELCEILRVIPRSQRGLWCNRAFGHAELMRRTFNPAVSNVNVHMDAAAADEFRRGWPEVRIVGEHKDCEHAPVWAALKDLVQDESERWERIAGCDINKHWSAMVGEFRGQPRAWFCEVAGAQAIAYQDEPSYPDTGLDPRAQYEHETAPGDRLERTVGAWWQLPMASFAHQARKHCHECGVPFRGEKVLALSGATGVSATHSSLRGKRAVELVTVAPHRSGRKFTEYV